MLRDTQRDCVFNAKRLGDYQSIDIDTLATKYCEAIDKKDKLNQNSYLAALILRFWYVIDKLYKRDSRLNLDREDFFMWVVEGIQLACQYRAWLDPKKKVNAQACINQAIATVRLRKYYLLNRDARKLHYMGVLFSLDQEVLGMSPNSVKKTTIADVIVDEDEAERAELRESAGVARAFIQKKLDDNKYIDAIILDLVAFGDTFIHKTHKNHLTDEMGNRICVDESESAFSKRNLMKLLSNLPEGYKKYFADTYKVALEPLNASLNKINKVSAQTLKKYMENCFNTCKGTLKADLYAE